MQRAWLIIIPLLAACTLDENDLLDGDDIASETLALEEGAVFATVAAGRMHSCALTYEGGAECWGAGGYGQLGQGAFADASEPTEVAGLSDAVAITAGWFHSCALRADGTVACWGYNTQGQLGDGTETSRATPVPVAGLANVVSVSAGGYHTCAVTAAGNVACWGYNAYGALGDGSKTGSSTPRLVGTKKSFWGGSLFVPETNAVEVDAGLYHTCARNAAGAVRCWGRNHAGQLGDGSTTDRLGPVTVQTIADAIDVSAGEKHSCAVVQNGSFWCWGDNQSGQLADNSTIARTTPVRGAWIAALGTNYPLYGVSSVSADGSHTCVTHASEAMWCAGNNDFGQHGMEASGAKLVRKTPVNAIEVSAGLWHTCVRTPAGNIRCVGRDDWHQLGGLTGCSDEATVALGTVAAPFGELLTLDGIHYLTGNAADLTLITDECASIETVKLGGLTLGTAPNPDGGTRYYRVIGQTYSGDGTKRVRIRIHFTNGENGTSFPVEVSMRSAAAGATVSVETMLVGVLRVEGNGGVLMLSENEIRNEVVVSMFEKFGDANHYHRGSYPDLYDFDYSALQVHLTAAGVKFHGKAKARLSGDIDLCNPTVTVDGTFKVVVDPVTGYGLTTQWVNGPIIDTDFPLFCDVLTLELIQIAAEITDWTTDDNVQRRIDKRIRELGEVCEEPLAGCSNVVQSIEHLDGAVEIEIKPLVKTIAIRNAYDSGAVMPHTGAGDPMARGMAIPTGWNLTFTTTGLVETCTGATWDCTQWTRFVAGTGVFNSNANSPISTPWPDCSSPPCPVYTGRIAPWKALRVASRDPAKLPLPNHSVATLVGRTLSRVNGSYVEGTAFNAGDPLCVMPPVSAPGTKLVLGRNDVKAPTGGWLGEYGTGEAIVTIGFTPPTIANLLDRCAE